MKRGLSKKGVSPLIATVLLVGFTIALIALVIVWARGFITEKAQKEDVLAQTRIRCQSLAFDVTYFSQAGTSLTAKIKNIGSQNIDGFIFQAKGENEVQPVELLDIIKRADTREVGAAISSDIGEVSSVDIIPRIKAGKGTYVPCSGQHKEARVQIAEPNIL